MKKVKTRNKNTGKIEIFQEFVAKQNDNLEIIDEGEHLEEEYEEELPELRDAGIDPNKGINKDHDNSSRKKYSPKSSNRRFLGYGEDEGEDQSIRLNGVR